MYWCINCYIFCTPYRRVCFTCHKRSIFFHACNSSINCERILIKFNTKYIHTQKYIATSVSWNFDKNHGRISAITANVIRKIYIGSKHLRRINSWEERVTHFVRDMFFFMFYCSEMIKEATLLLNFQKWDHPTLVLNSTATIRPKQKKSRLYLVCFEVGLHIVLMTHSCPVRLLSIDPIRYKFIGPVYWY